MGRASQAGVRAWYRLATTRPRKGQESGQEPGSSEDNAGESCVRREVGWHSHCGSWVSVVEIPNGVPWQRASLPLCSEHTCMLKVPSLIPYELQRMKETGLVVYDEPLGPES